MHAVIGAAVVVYLYNENVFIYDNEPRDPMKDGNGAYYGFEKDMDVDEASVCTRSEKEEDAYDKCIGAELQIPNKDGMKRMAIVSQRLHGADGNPEGNGSYRASWHHIEHEIEFCDGSTSKPTRNIIYEKFLSQFDS